MDSIPTGTSRIMVVGCGGAGKSTFAKRLASVLDLPLVHLDVCYWKPGWIEPSTGEWEEIVRGLVAGEAWVMDGNYGGTMDLRIERAEVVIFLDLPTLVCLWGAIRRRLDHAGRSRPDMAPDCPERLEWQFIRYIWNYRKTRRPGILERLRNLPKGKTGIVLSGRREVDSFLWAMGSAR